MLNQTGRKVSIEEARGLSKRLDVMIHWRPELLPEPEQYAIVYIVAADETKSPG